MKGEGCDYVSTVNINAKMRMMLLALSFKSDGQGYLGGLEEMNITRVNRNTKEINHFLVIWYELPLNTILVH